MKVELDDIVFDLSPLTGRVYMGVKTAKKDGWRYKRDVTDTIVSLGKEVLFRKEIAATIQKDDQ